MQDKSFGACRIKSENWADFLTEIGPKTSENRPKSPQNTLKSTGQNEHIWKDQSEANGKKPIKCLFWTQKAGENMLDRNEELYAMSWKCQQIGISYGKMMQKCTQQDIREICREYEEARRIKKNRGSPPQENQSDDSQRSAR